MASFILGYLFKMKPDAAFYTICEVAVSYILEYQIIIRCNSLVLIE